ncbi:MAG: DUF4834 family protein [Flavobacteriaceae bacterium]|nr:DUF4834 family protein [Flavobacteriaceae bacterium]
METASFSGFIETICYILMFYYVFKFLARLLLPIMVKKVFEKAGQNFKKQYQNQQNSDNQEEKVSNTSTATKPRENKKVGEYVDFEEIE